ncbi:MAG: oxygen-dependent coproporphyrinogen oxidase [Bacteroidetes bacterium]|nr:oxygen-dependent coproporphyrinogen oxidase [Bacteroidota bacterium]
MPGKEEITEWLRSLQDHICNALEAEDGKGRFIEDNWQRAEGGGGRTRIIQHGSVIEKGGVLFSAVHGPVPDFLTKENAVGNTSGMTFYATGVSIVIHPSNPMVPIIHMNVRYFEMSNGTWWFGGGIDLTPHYVAEEDAQFFHNALKASCDKHGPSFYPDFKKWADDYFYIPHRNETRGVGGIFFDKLSQSDKFSKEQRFAFLKEIGNTFAPVYTALMHKNKSKPYSEANKQWQLLRRGRYVEFNLVYDKGTKFGLETNGRTESILMSLPETAGWQYNYIPEPGSAEEKTLSLLKKGISWAE